MKYSPSKGRSCFSRISVALALLTVQITSAASLEIKIRGHGPNSETLTRIAVILEGKLGTGDFNLVFSDFAVSKDALRLAQTDRRFLAAGSPFYLDSAGGSVREALRIAREFRRRGFWTAVDSGSTCASACVLLVMGGERRWISRDATIIIHKPDLDDGEAADPMTRERVRDKLKYELIAFAEELQVDKRLIIAMFETSYDRPRRLDDAEIALWQLATDLGNPLARLTATSGEAMDKALGRK